MAVVSHHLDERVIRAYGSQQITTMEDVGKEIRKEVSTYDPSRLTEYKTLSRNPLSSPS